MTIFHTGESIQCSLFDMHLKLVDTVQLILQNLERAALIGAALMR
jgi:hypothetical protein